MNAISLPQLDPELQAWLSRRAASHGVSLAEEVGAILKAARASDMAPAQPAKGSWVDRLPPPMKLPPGAPSTLDLIREDRDSR